MNSLESLLQLLNQEVPCGTSGDMGSLGELGAKAVYKLVRKTSVFLARRALGAEWVAGSVRVPWDSTAHHAHTRCCRKTSSMLEVDDEGGRMFLRVLIHLTMHDYAPLVSGALQLLFKHFSQRQEAMHTFKQVLPPPQLPGPQGRGGRPEDHQAPAPSRQAALATHWPMLGTGG